MELPPLSAGASNVTVACPSSAVACTLVGASGTSSMVMLKSLVKSVVPVPVPFMIVAVTTTVPAPVALAWLPLTAAPSAVLPVPKLHVIVWFVALTGPTVPLNITGVPTVPVAAAPVMSVTGTKAALGVTEFEGCDGELLPTLFAAITVNVYAVPLVKPVTVIGLPVPVFVILPGFDVTV